RQEALVVPALRDHLGGLAATLAGPDLHLVHPAALELTPGQYRLIRMVPALVGEVVVVGVLPHHLAHVPERAGDGAPQPGRHPPPPGRSGPPPRSRPAPTGSAPAPARRGPAPPTRG